MSKIFFSLAAVGLFGAICIATAEIRPVGSKLAQATQVPGTKPFSDQGTMIYVKGDHCVVVGTSPSETQQWLRDQD
jgi:hypothetical protein